MIVCHCCGGPAALALVPNSCDVYSRRPCCSRCYRVDESRWRRFIARPISWIAERRPFWVDHWRDQLTDRGRK